MNDVAKLGELSMGILYQLFTMYKNYPSKAFFRLLLVIIFCLCCVFIPILQIFPYYEKYRVFLFTPNVLISRHFLFESWQDSWQASDPLHSYVLTGFLMVVFGVIVLIIAIFTFFSEKRYHYETNLQPFHLGSCSALFFGILHLTIFILIIITDPFREYPFRNHMGLIWGSDYFYVKAYYNSYLLIIYALGIFFLTLANRDQICPLIKSFLTPIARIRALFQSQQNSQIPLTSRNFFKPSLRFILVLIFILGCTIIPLLQLFPYYYDRYHYFHPQRTDENYDYYLFKDWQVKNLSLSIELTGFLMVFSGLCLLPFAIYIFRCERRSEQRLNLKSFHLTSSWVLSFAFLHLCIFVYWILTQQAVGHVVGMTSTKIEVFNLWYLLLYILSIISLLMANLLDFFPKSRPRV